IRNMNYRNVYFFFSSRRRHTRFSRDWSSDVCSSDLAWKPVRDRVIQFFKAPFGAPGHVIRNIPAQPFQVVQEKTGESVQRVVERDRKSTRLNSSHVKISYAVLCLKKKKAHVTTRYCR